MQDEGKEKLNCYMVKSLNRRGARGGLSLRLPTGFIRPDPTGSECSIFSRPMIDINAERQRRQGIAERMGTSKSDDQAPRREEIGPN